MRYIIAALIFILSASPGYADTPCLKLLGSCNEAVNALESSLYKQEDVIQKQQKLLDNQAKQIVKLKETAWYENKWLWFGVGALAGGWVVKEAQE